MENPQPDSSGNINLDRSDYRKPKKRPDPVWEVVWRFLLICAVIDGGVYFYFHVIENTTVFDGLARIRDSIQRERVAGPPTPPAITTQVMTVKKSDTPDRSQYAKVERPAYNKPAVSAGRSAAPEPIYCWEDGSGKRFYSNTGYPDSGYYKAVHLK
jgi:hypothetical protein